MSFIPKEVAPTALNTVQSLVQGHREVLIDHVRKQFKTLNERQYKRLRQSDSIKSPYSQVIAKQEYNESRNRYIDIIPYDYNRIKLSNKSHLGPYQSIEEDYINASLVEFDLDATQGPLPSTIGDFWRMILEQEVKVIVCLTPEKENGRNKCAAYWPIGNDQTFSYTLKSSYKKSSSKRRTSLISNYFLNPSKSNNNSPYTNRDDQDGEEEAWIIQVNNEQPETYDEKSESIIRYIKVTCSYKGKIVKTSYVYQLQFLGWVDHGIPNETHHVNALIQLTNQLQQQSPSPTSPIVIHCSAGCGRTGTFCVIDSCTEWLKETSFSSSLLSSPSFPSFDPVFELADLFRQQRTTMVQAPPQLLFCYQAIWDMLQELKGDK
ncbi:unnamed protein product [Cunninghamella blakesleeana]